MKQPLISVIIPTFNSQEYLREAIKSVLNQTYQQFQLLILDDGSTDDTVSIVGELSDQRITLFISSENKGQSYQLNKGIEHSKGEFVCIMHSDDLMHPRKLEQQLLFFQQHPLTGICGCNIELIGQNSGTWLFPENDQACKDLLLFSVPFAHPAVMIKKCVLNNISPVYNTQMAAAEDYDLWVRLANSTNFGNVQQLLLKYRIHPSQLSVIKKKEEKTIVNAIRRKLIEKLFSISNETDIVNCFTALYYPEQLKLGIYLSSILQLWESNKGNGFFSATVIKGRLKHSLFNKVAAIPFTQKIGCLVKYPELVEIAGLKTILKILLCSK